ncbi:hypothetical protein DdX_22470 [Ditylenchus destructor]|uniref:Uncharacterized protein n=1 Tax=Ditylenchus destructor TaxID=166010 RepID=A0AAD4MEB6_9BILA|nr:hypothetical protein DdX_22470 [Ditylenchus destructor]
MDNGTMIESFKFLNYYQLAKNSLVSKRYRNLIRTHRHKLALLDVDNIYMNSYVSNQDHFVVRMFNEVLSLEGYNKFIVRNGYSKHEDEVAGKETPENGRVIYALFANVYPIPNNHHGIAATVFSARAELKDENWPLFQHFFRLLMDPFIYIRTLALNPQKHVFSALAVTMNPDRDRLQCQQLNIRFNGDTKKFIIWVKNHVRCDEFVIYGNSDSNYDEELLDFFMTGAPCTSAIKVTNYDLSKVIVDLVRKFKALKNGDEYQIVEIIRGEDED